MTIFDHFAFLAPYYDRLFPARAEGGIFDLLPLPVKGRVLDAGGGTGRVAQHFKGRADHVIVMDLSQEMLLQAMAKGGLDTACARSEKLPFPDEEFECIIMVDALHHVYDQRQTLQELLRVLKPGGRLVIEEPDIRTWGVKILAILEKMLGMRSHFLPPQRIAVELNCQTETRVKVQGYTSWVIVDKTPT